MVFSGDDLRVAEFRKAQRKTPNELSQTVATRSKNSSAETTSVERAARETGLNGFPRLRFSRDEAESRQYKNAGGEISQNG